jgi:four helix bundle protein
MQDFKDLSVWQKAHQLAIDTYKASAEFPASVQFGLTNQIWRCAVSIAANIAEGRGRETDADFKRFLQIAIGSSCELECHLILARDLGFLSRTNSDRLALKVSEVRKMLSGLRRRLKLTAES